MEDPNATQPAAPELPTSKPLEQHSGETVSVLLVIGQQERVINCKLREVTVYGIQIEAETLTAGKNGNGAVTRYRSFIPWHSIGDITLEQIEIE